MEIKKYPSTGEKEPEKKARLSAVTKGTVVTGDRPAGFFEKLGGGSPGDVKSYLLTDILIPAAKNLIGDIIADGIHMLLWGSPAAKSKSSGSRISYDSYYGNRRGSIRYDRDRDRDDDNVRSRNSYQFDNITINSRPEAEEVMSLMREIVDVYDRVSVADYYELVGVTGQYTDCDYGWKSLSGVDVKRTKNGFYIDLPKAVPLK